MTLRLSSKTDQELCDMSATSTFPPEGMELPSGRQFKLYQSMNGLNDTPKSVVDGVRSSLCRLDDIMSRCSPCMEVRITACCFPTK